MKIEVQSNGTFLLLAGFHERGGYISWTGVPFSDFSQTLTCIKDLERIVMDKNKMTDTTEKLLPCPFCNGEAKVYNHHDFDKQMQKFHNYFVACQQCCAQTDNDGETELTAIGAWNRRVAEKPKWTKEPKEPGIHVVKFNQYGDLGVAKVFQDRTVAIHNWNGLYRAPEDFSSHARWLRTDIPGLPEEGEPNDD